MDMSSWKRSSSTPPVPFHVNSMMGGGGLGGGGEGGGGSGGGEGGGGEGGGGEGGGGEGDEKPPLTAT